MRKSSAAVCILTALAALTAAGCGSSSGESKKTTPAKTTTAAQTAAPKETDDTAATEETTGETTAPTADTESSAGAVDNTPGEGLEKTRQLFDGDYTYKVKTTFSDDPDNEITTVVRKQGELVYITYTDEGSKVPDRAYFSTGTTAYDIDYGLKIYASREVWKDYNLILSLLDQPFEKTEAHPPKSEQDYSAEQYTYTGDTYMTVFDFYFDSSNALKEYTVTYTVEGQDDIVQHCKVEKLVEVADIKSEPLGKLTDFGSMTEDQRLGFCQGICGERGISTDNMYEMNITTDDLKRIDFETFTKLVYTYGK